MNGCRALPYAEWSGPMMNWQYEYRIKGDEKALNKMYRLGEIIALRYINTVAKKNKAVAKLAQCDKEEKAHNAITYITALQSPTPRYRW